MQDELVAQAADWCAAAQRIALLCGAGLSAASGVPTFRGPQGLWRQHRPEDLASPLAFARDPLLVWQWYAERQAAIAACAPNAGHHAIAAWLASDRTVTVVTQNVDGLQQRACVDAGVDAGDRILELHGCLWTLRCPACWSERRLAAALAIDGFADLPVCAACGATERPGVVWFGEALDMDLLQRAAQAAAESEVLIVAGTSGVVEPAASLARCAGGRVIEINPEATPLSGIADVSLRGPSELVLPRLLALR